MFKREGMPRIQDLTTNIEKKDGSMYEDLRRHIERDYAEQIASILAIIQGGSWASRINWDEMAAAFLVIALGKVPSEIRDHHQTSLFESIANLRSDLVRKPIARENYAKQLLLTDFCTRHIFGEALAELRPDEWLVIEECMAKFLFEHDWTSYAYFAAFRFILHPEHPRPSSVVMERIIEGSARAVNSLGSGRSFLFCTKLLAPQEFPDIPDVAWTRIFSAPGRPKSATEFAFQFLAASELTLEGSMLKINPPPKTSDNKESRPLPLVRSI